MPDDTKAARLKEPEPQAENWGAALIEGNQKAFTRWMDTFLSLSQEITSFTQHRFQEDLDTLFALAACRNAAEAFERQQHAVARAFQEYTGEIAKFGPMVTHLVWEGMSGLNHPRKASP